MCIYCQAIAVPKLEQRQDLRAGDTVDLYLRISRDPGHDELGVRRQERECRELCKQRGWQVAAVHVDDDRSAFSGKPRPGYEHMLQRLERGQVRGLVAWHPDRLHRSPVELERFITVVEAIGAGVATVQGGEYDLSTASGRMSARIVGAVARHESEHKSERLRAKMQELIRDGKLTGGGKRPYGYNDDRLTVREHEAAVVREAARRVRGGESLLSVVRDFNDRSIRAASGGPWTLSSLSRLLRSLRIAGLRNDGRGQPIAAPWPATISQREHKQIAALLAKNSRSGVRWNRTYLLSGGLIRCASCGARMVGRPINGKPTYMCDKGRGGCNQVAVRALHVDELVRLAVIQVVDGPGLARRMQRAAKSNGSDHVLAQMTKQEERLQEIESDYASGELDRAEYRRLRDQAKARLEELRADFKPEPKLDFGDQPLAAAWPALSLGQRRAVLDAVLDEVRVQPVGHQWRTGKSSYFDADRITLVWKV
jgi:DNA invertase Pin-like site-specific DNA recombinase